MSTTKIVILALAQLFYAATAPAAFKYTPFPDIPHSQVQTNTFVADLGGICSGFAKRCAKPADAESTPICFTAPDRAAEATALSELKKSDTALNAAASSITYLGSSVRTACIALQTGQPLTEPQLELLRAVRDNPALREVVDGLAAGETRFEAVNNARGTPGKAHSLTPQAALPGFEGIQGQLIQGLADFLAKRAKQEALAYLTKELKRDLCKEPAKQFYVSTCATLETLDASRPLSTIRASFKAAVELDLRALPDVLLAYVMTDASASGTVKNVAFGARIALAYARALGQQRDALEVARSLGELPQQDCEKQKQCSQVGSGIRLASAMVYSAAQGGANWSSYFETIAASGAGEVAVVAFGLVLLSEARWMATDANGQPFALSAINAFIAKPVKLWLDILELRNEWLAAVERAKILSSEADRLALFARITELSYKNLSALADLSGQLRSLPPQTDAVIDVASHVIEAHSLLLQREYAQAFSHVTLALRAGFDGKLLPAEWNRHLGFLVEVAEAKSAEGVSIALDAYAEPVGSYAQKYTNTQIALNAMVGLFGGGEYLSTRGVQGTSFAFGGFAPVGVHMTTPIGQNGEEQCFHFGLLLSVIDLGALTTYRFKEELDDNNSDEKALAERVPQVGLEQVLSPGAFITLGLGGTPLVLGAGAAVTPELRAVTASGAQLQAGALRFGLTLGIDVPVLFIL